MTRLTLIIPALVALVIVGAAGSGDAYDARGGAYLNPPSCSEYLDAYSKTELTVKGFKGPHEAWEVFGFINGAMSVYNANTDNGINNIIEGMTTNDARRWMASWCRDNQQENLVDAISALIRQRLKK